MTERRGDVQVFTETEVVEGGPGRAVSIWRQRQPTIITNNNSGQQHTQHTAHPTYISPQHLALYITTEPRTRAVALTEGLLDVNLNYSPGNKESSAYWLALGALEKNKTAATVQEQTVRHRPTISHRELNCRD